MERVACGDCSVAGKHDACNHGIPQLSRPSLSCAALPSAGRPILRRRYQSQRFAARDLRPARLRKTFLKLSEVSASACGRRYNYRAVTAEWIAIYREGLQLLPRRREGGCTPKIVPIDGFAEFLFEAQGKLFSFFSPGSPNMLLYPAKAANDPPKCRRTESLRSKSSAHSVGGLPVQSPDRIVEGSGRVIRP